ncbi:MAG TPA: hypothetical protein VM243_11730 [Phycisphaerae bacterium]|nr:hypothetical protein [Phycisphaerae bacterium]
MSCPNDADLIRLLAGELDDGPSQNIRRHLTHCRACAATLAELQITWQVLAAGDEEEVTSDLWPAVRLAAEREAMRPTVWVPRTPPALLRAAASIAVALGLGWLAGSWVGQPAGRVSQPNGTVPEEELIEALGLDELAALSATGLPETWLSTDQQPTEDAG